jgi:hypothetical protein
MGAACRERHGQQAVRHGLSDRITDALADTRIVTVEGPRDVEPLKRLGLNEVFTPGAPTGAIVEFIRRTTLVAQAGAVS